MNPETTSAVSGSN